MSRQQPPPARKARVLFLAEAVTLSHVARPTVLAQALDPEAYEVTLACDPRYDRLVGDTPFARVPLQSVIPTENLLEVLQGVQPLFDVAALDRYVQEDLQLIWAFRPDLVVGDMRQSLAVSSRLASVPFANVINAQWSPYARLPFELPENPFARVAGERLGGMIFSAWAPFGFAYHTLPLNAVRAKYGLPPLGFDLKEVFSHGDYVLYPDVPELVPTYNLPATHRYIGPILWSPHVEKPEWWDRVPDDKPIVYVSLGSSGQQGLLATILNALSKLPVYVMAATAGAVRLDSAPGNAFLADFLPGVEAARRARLVICNGGNLSTQQALAAGAPVLCVVSNLDQLVFAKSVQEAGAGEFVREREVEAGRIRRLAWKLLHHMPYGRAARRIAEVYGRSDAAGNFRAFVDSVVGARARSAGA